MGFTNISYLWKDRLYFRFICLEIFLFRPYTILVLPYTNCFVLDCSYLSGLVNTDTNKKGNNLTLIPKPNKDLLHWQNYDSISQLKVDLKLFTEISANRLIVWLIQIAHQDQVGFILSGEARENICSILNVIPKAHFASTHFMLLASDIVKAFYLVNWDFIEQMIAHIEISGRLLVWIRELYTCPSAQLKVNGSLSSSFSIYNGIRQGCLLWSLIFVLTLEPFLRRVWNNLHISEIVFLKLQEQQK